MWLQLRHGSVRLANGCDRSSLDGVGGGFGFFHPLHLQDSSAWNKACMAFNIALFSYCFYMHKKCMKITIIIIIIIVCDINESNKIGDDPFFSSPIRSFPPLSRLIFYGNSTFLFTFSLKNWPHNPYIE